MRHPIIAATLMLVTCTPAAALAQDDAAAEHFAALQQRVEICATISEATRTPEFQGVSEIDLLDRALDASGLTAAEKLGLIDACFAFWAGRRYQAAVQGPRA